MWNTRAAQVVAGLLVADFLTATAHWFEDTYLPYSEAPTLLGQISRDNEMHHFLPMTITTGSWWSTMKVSVLLLAVIGIALGAAAPRWAWTHRAFLGTAAAAMAVTNLVHRFQHERDCRRPAVVTTLQRVGLLVSREQHSVHHAVPDQKYGVLLGFTNWVYDSLGVWRALEALLAVAGMEPAARKPSVEAYKWLYDDDLRRLGRSECPDRLTPEQVRRYQHALRAAHRAGAV